MDELRDVAFLNIYTYKNTYFKPKIVILQNKKGPKHAKLKVIRYLKSMGLQT